MFNNTQDGDARLRAWRTFRNDFPHNGTALDVALGFKGIKPKPRYIDYYNPQDWPNVFDIVKEGYLCQSGVSIVIASTLHNLGFINTESLNFEMISNHVTGNDGAVFIHAGKVYNLTPGQTNSVDELRALSITLKDFKNLYIPLI